MRVKAKTYKTLYRVTAVFLAVFIVLGVIAGTLLVLCRIVENDARVLPSYPREDLTAALAKANWTKEDYRFLYLQTGLTKVALDDFASDRSRLLSFQDALFFEGEVRHKSVAAFSMQDYLYDPDLKDTEYTAPIAKLQNGDVLVTSTSHTLGWRNGHAAIVVHAENGSVLESLALGKDSSVSVGGAVNFRRNANFMVLRLKDADEKKRAEIAALALKLICNVPYSVTVGVLSPKDQCENGTKRAEMTHCSHLVWQAFRNFGYDVDSDGGPICTAKDIANSPCFELVQVYGFDPEKLWQ